MKKTVSYKRTDLADDWDAVIIGSGIGGLATAAILSKEGWKVLVLERHYTAGGFTHAFRRPNYEWDVGLHYIGEVMKETSITRRLFDYITDGRLEWADMGPVYDRIRFGEEVYPFRKGSENFKAELKRRFVSGADRAAIDSYLDLVYEVSGQSMKFFTEKAMPPIVGKVAGPVLRRGFGKYAGRTTLDVLSQLTDNPKLIAVLTGQWGDYGLPPSQSSFAMHAILVRHYMNGGAYPVGGAGAILESIAPVIQQSGGLVVTNAEVVGIETDGKKATGVRIADDSVIEAPIIISGAGYHNTVDLLDPGVAERADMISHRDEVEPSASHVCLYIGCQRTDEELELPKSNWWIYPDNYDHDENLRRYLADPHDTDFPVTYVSFPSAKDPDWQNRYPGTSTIEIITVAPHEWFTKWEKTRWKKRGDDYEAFKEEFSQRLLQKLYEVEPQVEGEIDYYELSTPLSTAHFANYAHGEIYGIEHTPERFEKRFLRAHTPIKKLFLTGQDVVTAGIGGALAASMITTSAILKQNVPDKLFD